MSSFTEYYMGHALGIIERAHQAYHRRMSGEYGYMQPANGADIYKENEIEYVVLSNVRGILAVYKVVNDDRLEWSEYIPKECLLDYGAEVYTEESQEYVVKTNGFAVLASYKVLEDGTLKETEYIPEECREAYAMDG